MALDSLEDHSLPGFAGAEHFSRGSQIDLKCRCERVCASEHAPRDPPRVLERLLCLVEIVERGAGVPVISTQVLMTRSRCMRRLISLCR